MFKFVKSYFNADASTYVGRPAEVTTQNDGTSLAYHDGVTPGGIAISPPVTLNLTPAVGTEVPPYYGFPQANYGYNVVNPAASSGYGIILPAALPGAVVTLICNPNANGFDMSTLTNAIYVWPFGDDIINGLADLVYWVPDGLYSASPDISMTLPCICVCQVAGQWFSNVVLG